MRVIIIGKPIKYKNFKVLVQNIGEIFQAIIFDVEAQNYYQLYRTISFPKTRQRFSTLEMRRGYEIVADMALATCDAILLKNNPELLIKRAKGKAKTDKEKQTLKLAEELSEDFASEENQAQLPKESK